MVVRSLVATLSSFGAAPQPRRNPKLCVAAALALAPAVADAQHQIDWVRTFAGSGNSQEMRQTCAFAPTGEVFVVFDSAELAVGTATQQRLVAYDASGSSLASIVLDTSPSDVTAGQHLAVDSAGRARTLMTTGANVAVRRAELKCVTSGGNVIWSREVDAFVGAAERGRAHSVDALDRSYVVTERTSYNFV